MILGSVLELWSSAWPAGITMLGLGSGFALVLLIATRLRRLWIRRLRSVCQGRSGKSGTVRTMCAWWTGNVCKYRRGFESAGQRFRPSA